MGQGIVENVILLVDLNLKIEKTLLFGNVPKKFFHHLIIDKIELKSRLRDKVVPLTLQGH